MPNPASSKPPTSSGAGPSAAGASSRTPPGAEPSFLDRQRWGLSHWLIIAMAVIFMMGFVPRGVRKAIESNVNKAEDWLPKDYPESNDLRWFAQHFIGAKFVLVSWDGCKLRDEAPIDRVVALLEKETDEHGDPIFKRILTGPNQVASLTQEPSNLSRSAAIERLEGALVGPPQLTPEEARLRTDDAEEAQTLADQSRPTCLVAYLSPYMTNNNLRMRYAVELVSKIVQEEVGVAADQVHLGGPPVDNITIDIEGEKTLMRLAGLSGLVGLGLSFWCFRSLRLTWFVFSVAGISAGVSLAIVYWYGVLEITAFGFPMKRLGTVDAILMSMPAVVYVLGLSGAIHIVNYYRDERDARGLHGAVERGVRIGWGPCALAALTTAVGLGSLGASEIVPIRKFGVFSAAGVMATVGVLLTILPVTLHLFPPKLPGDKADDEKHAGKLRKRKKKQRAESPWPQWVAAYAGFVSRNHTMVALGCLAMMVAFALGLPRIHSQVRLLKLLDPNTKLIHDYAWFEQHLGNLVPMEVVVALSDDQLRSPREPSDEDQRYRMTMYERLRMVERIQRRIEQLEPVSRAMSAATFGPADRNPTSASERRATDFTISEALEESRDALAEYLVTEKTRGIPRPVEWSDIEDGEGPADPVTGPMAPPRELWRISARVAALTDIDYGDFVVELQQQVEPVLDVYRLRDQLLAKLREKDKPLVGSRVAVVFDGDAELASPDEGTDDALLVEILKEGGVPWRGGAVATINAAKLREAGDSTQSYRKTLASLDAVVTVTKGAAEALAPFAGEGVTLVSLTEHGADTAHDRAEANASLMPDESLRAVYTGIVPLVYKTQRELLNSLAESIGYATVLIACVMVIVLRSVGGGLVSMIPNIFPIVSVFGSLGWLGISVDIGIMMTASVALGVAVDDTIHFLTWFRRGIVQGLDRRSATLQAFDRCALAMMQTTLIAGLGLAVFATSTFTPTQQFGTLMITMLGAALVGDLVMLPALLCGPLGRFFAPGAAAKPIGAPADEAAAAAPKIEASAESPVAQSPVAASNAPKNNGHTEPAPEQPPAEPVGANQPTPAEPLSPSNAALRAKLQKFRRSS